MAESSFFDALSLSSAINNDIPTKVYHYTKIDSAAKILLGSRFILSSCKSSNDSRESSCRKSSDNGGNSIEDGNRPSDIRREWRYWAGEFCPIDGIDEYKFISTCVGRPSSIGGRKGYANPALWHYYGESHEGVCIEFDIEKLRCATNPRHHGRVAYRVRRVTRTDEMTPLEFLMEKGVEWCGEMEYRFIYSADLNDVDISGCVTGVCFGVRCNEGKRSSIIESLNNTNIDLYNIMVDTNDNQLYRHNIRQSADIRKRIQEHDSTLRKVNSKE